MSFIDCAEATLCMEHHSQRIGIIHLVLVLLLPQRLHLILCPQGHGQLDAVAALGPLLHACGEHTLAAKTTHINMIQGFAPSTTRSKGPASKCHAMPTYCHCRHILPLSHLVDIALGRAHHDGARLHPHGQHAVHKVPGKASNYQRHHVEAGMMQGSKREEIKRN